MRARLSKPELFPNPLCGERGGTSQLQAPSRASSGGREGAQVCASSVHTQGLVESVGHFLSLSSRSDTSLTNMLVWGAQ